MTETKPHDFSCQEAALRAAGVEQLRSTDGLPESIVDEWKKIVRESNNAQVMLRIPREAKIKNPIEINYCLDQKLPHLAEDHLIVAEANSQVMIVIDYRGDSDYDHEKFSHQGRSLVIAEDGAHVTVIKVQRLGFAHGHADYNIAKLGPHAVVNWFTIELGSAQASTTIVNELMGQGSRVMVTTLFLGDKDRRLEQNYEMIHYGPHSVSEIKNHGALKDQSQSCFKGTLDIKKGAKKTEAREGQRVLLLNKGVHAHAQPILLCGEDDVKANHAASAGQLEEEKLYYLMTRGLTRDDAKRMVIEGSFRPLIDEIPLAAVRDQVQQEITRRFSHGEDL